jgi:hypothetical protein
MPAQYEAIKKELMKKGYGEKYAETHAAKIYNAMGKGHVGKGSK